MKTKYYKYFNGRDFPFYYKIENSKIYILWKNDKYNMKWSISGGYNNLLQITNDKELKEISEEEMFIELL